MLDQQEITLLETRFPPRLSLHIPGLKHVSLAFCNAWLASVIFVLSISALLLLAEPDPTQVFSAAICSDISLLFILMERYLEAPGKSLFLF